MDPIRLELTYQTVSDDGVARELPFVVGVIGDFAADAKFPSDASRQFVAIDEDSFDRVMADIGPELTLQFGGRDTPLFPDVMALAFRSLDDFRPEALVDRIAPLKELLDERGDGGSVAEEATPPEPGGSILDQILNQSDPTPSPGAAPDRGARVGNAVLAMHLDAILHDEKFQRLESLWRGLRHLVEHGGDGERVKIRLMAISKRDLLRDFETKPELEDSILFKQIYTTEYAPPGGEPYGALVADYGFSAHPDDLGLLACIGYVGGVAHTPILTAASPAFFDSDWTNYSDLAELRSVTSHFDSPVFTRWRSFRESEDAKYVYLTVPRIRGRSFYGTASNPVTGFDYAEQERDHGTALWVNAAYSLARRLTQSFLTFGWSVVLEGTGADAPTGPVEADLGDALPLELEKQGFACVQHSRTGDGLYFATASARKPSKYHEDAATRTEELAARLPHVIACARIAHYLMRIAVENRPGVASAPKVAELLNKWLADYTRAESDDSGGVFPLSHGEVEVSGGEHGMPKVLIARLRPSFQLDAAPLPMPVVLDPPFDL